jgi:AmmeMemoRadiSam system protein B/AmmeMemoRadiSam system protein A
MTAIRSPAVAGMFYPAEPDVLARQLARFLSDAGDVPPEAAVPKAIIAPHAGYVFSGPVAARAYARLAPARGRISRVVLTGPSHHVAFKGLAVDTASAWATPGGVVEIDTEAVAALRRLPMVGTLEAAYAREHALEVHVPFLRHVLGTFRLVPLVAGEVPAEAVAAALDSVWGGEETLIVVSTDLSHYLGYAACQAIDARTAAAIERLDGAAIAEDGACGRVPLRGLLLAARRRGMAVERLDLRNSGDTAGGRERVVGYGAWVLTERDDAERAEIEGEGETLLRLARGGILHGLQAGRPAAVPEGIALAPLLRAPGAAFVTLRQGGRLRGCIGSPMARRPLAEDVLDHAFNAAFRDPRFPPLATAELEGLDLSVSVLTPPEAMRFGDERDLLGQLRPGVDGLIIDDGGRRALFLPQVWEELREPADFLGHLKRKAGLRADHWSGSLAARRFRAIEVKGPMRGPGAAPDAEPFAWSAPAGQR